jgi:hypothetical protein
VTSEQLRELAARFRDQLIGKERAIAKNYAKRR